MATSPLLEYFTTGTEHTVTGASWGSEIETHFVYSDGQRTGWPIATSTTRQILASPPPGPWRTTIDLGRQLIELIVAPRPTPAALLATTLEGLDWLYGVASRLGTRPVFEPHLNWPAENLVWVQGKRDAIWARLDGLRALRSLAEVASVQITVSANPAEVVPATNALWAAGLHHIDYAANDTAWRSYIESSLARYRPERYAGPAGFADLPDYCRYLERQAVVMYRGGPCRRPITAFSALTEADVRSFTGTSWPHYRLRVPEPAPGQPRTLAIEARPFSRRSDDQIGATLNSIVNALGL